MKKITLRPFFTYYGGKWRAAPKYPPPSWDQIIEPFAGSAGYSLRHFEKNVILYDINPIITTLWDFLIHASENDIKKIPDKINHVDELGDNPAEKYLVGFWLNKATTNPSKTPSAWMRKETNPNRANFWGPGVKSRIIKQLPYIRHWKVFNETYNEIPPTTYSTWFIDPPYQGRDGTHYKHSVVDYEHLATWCKNLKGQIIVCEQEGADWLPFKEFGTFLANNSQKTRNFCKEVIFSGDFF